MCIDKVKIRYSEYGSESYSELYRDTIINYRLFVGDIYRHKGVQTMKYNKLIIPIDILDYYLKCSKKEPIKSVFNIQCPSNIDKDKFIHNTNATLKILSDNIVEYNKKHSKLLPDNILPPGLGR